MRGPRGRRGRGRPSGSDFPGLAAALALTTPVWLLALHQSTVDLLAIGDVAPDLLCLGVGVVAWTRPGFGAVLFAALLGCVADVSSAAPWGLEGARLGFLAATFSSLRQAMATEVPGTNALMVACFVLVEQLTRPLLLKTCLPALDLGVALPRALAIAAFTAALAPLALLVSQSLEVEGQRP